MKNGILIILLVLLATSTYAQIKFEKGYFIDNEGTKVECLIKNSDWVQNPAEIEYKSGENYPAEHLTPSAVKEFGVYNSSKYVATTVNIDRSPARVSQLNTSASPIFKEERLFLKVLVEGKASLYGYEADDLKRFFYSIDGSQIEQLIFKEYKEADKIKANSKFRQQLYNSLTCSSIEREKLEKLDYNKKALVKLFSEYNNCSGSKFATFEDKVERRVFTISVRPRMNFSSLSAINYMDRSSNFDWGNQVEFGVGIEGEFFLPINKDKWSILIEPTYQSFSAGGVIAPDYSSPGGTIFAQVDYKSIQLPVGIRHYFFLNDNNQIFVNAAFVFDFPSSSSQVEVTRASGYPLSLLQIKNGSNLAFGAGFRHKAYSIEARYYTSRDILSYYMSWEGDYKTFSVVLGYSIFRKKS